MELQEINNDNSSDDEDNSEDKEEILDVEDENKNKKDNNSCDTGNNETNDKNNSKNDNSVSAEDIDNRETNDFQINIIMNKKKKFRKIPHFRTSSEGVPKEFRTVPKMLYYKKNSEPAKFRIRN